MARSGSVDMIYGDSGDGKTAALGEVAEWYYERTGKPSFLVNTDPGGWETIAPHVSAGIVIPYKVVQGRTYLMNDLLKLARGHRPLNLDDPMSPLSAAPQTDDIAALLLDGITSTSDMLMEWHLHSVKAGAQAGTITPTNVNIAGVPKENYIVSGEGEGSYIRRIASMTDYGEIQRTARELLGATAMLPIPAVWTALPCKGEDQNAKPIYGPAFMGNALTGRCGNLFGNLIHLYPTFDAQGNKRGLAYLRNHVDPKDPMKIPYPAKIRVPKALAHKVPPAIEPDMKFLYKAIEDLQREAVELLKVGHESSALVGASNA